METFAQIEAAPGYEPAQDLSDWPDSRLIEAVRSEPSDESALDTLVERYWGALFARCHFLTLDRQKASDLAQDAWCRLLRARHSLKPDGNFSAYLTTIATNLWRDANRAAHRAGAMAENRLLSLDAALPDDEGETVTLADAIQGLDGLEAQEQRQLVLEIDAALEHLTPLLRDVLVSRLVIGESCGEIGRRYARTEQTVSAWVRQAVREVKQHLETADQKDGRFTLA